MVFRTNTNAIVIAISIVIAIAINWIAFIVLVRGFVIWLVSGLVSTSMIAVMRLLSIRIVVGGVGLLMILIMMLMILIMMLMVMCCFCCCYCLDDLALLI